MKTCKADHPQISWDEQETQFCPLCLLIETKVETDREFSSLQEEMKYWAREAGDREAAIVRLRRSIPAKILRLTGGRKEVFINAQRRQAALGHGVQLLQEERGDSQVNAPPARWTPKEGK
jgi:hypothetical protein